jgi:hypothetical protein
MTSSTAPESRVASMRVEVSQVIERPVHVVFRFYADDQVRNHPRWDPYIELWLDSDAPLGVGTIIRRRNSRSGNPVEGTMEVVEYDRDRAFGVLTHEAPVEIRGRATFEPIAPDRTRLTITADMQGMDDSMKSRITSNVEQSLRTIKNLIEAEL